MVKVFGVVEDEERAACDPRGYSEGHSEDLGRYFYACGTGEVICQGDCTGTGVSTPLNDVLADPDGLSVVLACGDDGVLLKSTDAGESWSALETGTSADLIELAWTEDQSTAVVLGSEGTVLVSTDGLETFTAAESGTEETLRNAAIDEDGTWMLVGDGPTALVTSDLAAFTSLSAPGERDLTDVGHDGHGWLVSSKDGSVYKSTDDGASWETDLGPVGFPLHVLVAHPEAMIVVAAGYSPMLYVRHRDH